MTGLPKSIIKKFGITKKAWSVYRGRSKSSRKARHKVGHFVRHRNPGGKTRKMRRRYFHRRGGRSRSLTLPLALIGGAAGSTLMPNRTYTYGTAQYLKDGAFTHAVGNIVENFTGYSMWDKRWDMGALTKGLTPLVIGFLAHKFVGGRPLNVNAALARARVPVIRI